MEKAQNSDVIIAVVGQDEQRCGESCIRTGLVLPARQLQLLQVLKETGKPIVLVLINGQPLTINRKTSSFLPFLKHGFPKH